MSIVLKAENVTKVYGEHTTRIDILKNINISVEKGEFLSIMGPSGCGKSTLLYLLGGLDSPTSGTIYLDSVDINTLRDRKKAKLRRENIGFVFQFYNLVHSLNVEENIMLPIAMAGRKESDYKSKLSDLLEIVGLKDKRKQVPSKLSGGQQQRVSIARAIISEPKIILADEAIGNLDSKSGEDVMKLFNHINEELGITIIQVTHSAESALYGNRLIKMKDGIMISDEVINSL